MKQELDHDEVTAVIDTEPATLFDLVSDVTRTPEFSPYLSKCEWLDGATGPRVGARFKAVNTMGRGPAWSNKPVVTVVDSPTEFAFERTEPFAGTLEWRYRFEPHGSGTLVTESYTVVKPLTIVGWFIIGTLYGVRDVRAQLRSGMEETLQRIQAAVTTTAPPVG